MKYHPSYRYFGLAMLMVAMAGSAGVARAGIATTKHNLSVAGPGTVKSIDETEICVFCHTPHRAIKNDNIPLWNHNLSSAGNYGVYTSPTFDGATTIQDLGGTDATTAAVSNLCLSCHDGTVAINALNNPSNANPNGIPTMGGTEADGTIPVGNARLGTDLTDDHPVNFIFDSALFAVDNSLNDPATLSGVVLFNGTVQCASCHDPHNSVNPTFLRVSNTGSALCLRCHNK
ncbi:MAG TPA: cytochrome C [Gammaproteobacteria bacterium]|nr:cytochrome C [Gammaproteobacteria bacterium]